MGLEIQDDELDQPIFRGTQITSDYHTNRAEQIKWVRENFVDLGLPSGALWCKWNIGATCGDTPESWYGDYFAWGEVETKESFKWKNYKHGSIDSLTRYNDKDDKAILDPEDDVVSVTLGKDFKMPSKEDIEELCFLPNEWVKDYDGVEGLNGRIFKGNNGNVLFIPAAGYRDENILYHPGSYCRMWSSSLNTSYPDYGRAMYSYSSSNAFGNYCRYYGFSVRAVLKQ